MARKKVYVGQEELTYSKAILKITGWTKKEFETQKRLMRYRVSTYNKAMHDANDTNKLSAIEELYYKVKFEARRDYYESQGKPTLEYNSLQKLLLDLKTTHRKEPTEKQYELLKKFSEERFKKLVEHYPQDTKNIVQDFKNGKITLVEYNKKLGDFADEMRNLQKDNPAEYLKRKGQQIGSP